MPSRKRRFIKEVFPQAVPGMQLSQAQLAILIQRLGPEIRERVQKGLGKRNPTLKMLDTLIGAAKIAYGSEEVIQTMDNEIEYLYAQLEEFTGLDWSKQPR